MHVNEEEAFSTNKIGFIMFVQEILQKVMRSRHKFPVAFYILVMEG